MTMHELINMIENNEPIWWTDNDGEEHEVEVDGFDDKGNAVISFGRQVRDNIAQSWETAKNTEISFDLKGLAESISNKFNNPYSVNNLTKRPVSDLESMLKQELEA